ncbi:MAG: hypothetical protein Q7T46_12890 [Polaromonas sp.]|nr:hypothetical protein [Polaromonas sp.]
MGILFDNNFQGNRNQSLRNQSGWGIGAGSGIECRENLTIFHLDRVHPQGPGAWKGGHSTGSRDEGLDLALLTKDS